MSEENESLGFSESLEQDIISLAIKDTKFFLDIHRHLSHEHFSNTETAEIWKTIDKYFVEYHSIPEEDIIRHELTKKDIDLDDDYFENDGLRGTYLLDETLKLIRYQEMKSFVFKTAVKLDNPRADFEDLENDLKEILSIQPISDLGMIYFNVDEHFERLKRLNVDRIRTRIPIIDRALGNGIEEAGGLANKELIAFASATGVGKSFVLCIAGANMLREERKHVLHYTFEMSEERTALRYNMALLSKTAPDILEDIDDSKERLKHIGTMVNRHLVIKEFPTKTASVNTLRSHIRKLREQMKFTPDVIIVDYGDIMRSVSKFNNRYEEQGSIFMELRGLAQELDVPILTATQTNRGSMDKDIITAADLGDSFDKARIMDAIFALIQKPEDKEDGRLRIYEMKNRNGASGKMYGYELEYSKAQLKEIEEIDDGNE